MELNEEINRRGISLAVPSVKIISTGERARTSVHKTYVKLVGGVPTFVCDGHPVQKPAFETYIPTQYYFRQFAEVGTRIFGFSTNVAALTTRPYSLNPGGAGIGSFTTEGLCLKRR